MSENTTNSQTPAANTAPRPHRTFSPRVARPEGAPSGYQGNRPSGQRFGSRPGGAPQGAGQGGSRSFGQQRGPGGPGGNRFQNKRRGPNQENDDKNNFQTKVIQVRRVTRVVKGGKRMRFSALVVMGDLQGQFGVGLKKGNDYADAVNKATNQAKKTMKKFSLDENGSIPYAVTVKFKAAQIFLKPAVSGTGLIAGGPLRGILELAGVRNVLSKIIGSNNKISNVMAVYKALSSFETKTNTNAISAAKSN
jgi:small subunit ribosomal protein S5